MVMVLMLAGTIVGITAPTASAGREICAGARVFATTYEVCIPVP